MYGSGESGPTQAQSDTDIHDCDLVIFMMIELHHCTLCSLLTTCARADGLDARAPIQIACVTQ